MAMFGGYESVRELYRSGLGSVWAARRSGEPEPRFVVKVCSPDAALFVPGQVQQAVRRFREAAELARRLASGTDNDAPAWAPIYEVGGDDSSAYYVTDLAQPGSIERLVVGRVRPDARALQVVARAIASGLKALDERESRPHGNLKPTNVLIDGSGDLADSRVLITDPLAAELLDGEHDRGGDMIALGAIVHQLVTHQPPRTRGGPLAPAPQWKNLGAKGDRWRELCSRMLGLGVDEPIGLDGLLEELDGLVVRRRGPKPLVLVGAGAVALVVIGGGVAYVLTRGGPAPVNGEMAGVAPDAQEWAALADQYDKWFLPLRELGRGQRDRIAVDTDILSIIEEIERVEDSLVDPLKELRARGLAANTFGDARSQVPEVEPGSDLAARTRASLATLEGLRERLVAWPRGVRLRQIVDGFEARGWSGAASGIGRRFVWSGDQPPTPDEIEAAIELAPDAIALDDAWAALEPKLDRITAAAESVTPPDRVLLLFKPWAREQLRRGQSGDGVVTPVAERDRAVLRRAIDVAKKVEGRADELIAILDAEWQDIDHEAFGDAPVFQKVAAATPETETGTIFDDWKFDALDSRGPSAGDDPRSKWRAADIRARIGSSLADFRAGLGADLDDAARARLTQFEERASGASAEVEALESLRWNRRNQPQIVADAPRLESRLAALEQEIIGWAGEVRAAANQSEEQLREELRNPRPIAAGVPAINTVWETWATRLAGESMSTSGLRSAITEARAPLTDANVRMPAAPEQLAARTAWAAELLAAARDKRNELLAGAVLPFADRDPSGAAGPLAEAVDGAGRDYTAWLASLEAATAAAVSIESLLQDAYGYAEPDGEGKTLGSLASDVRGSAAAESPRVLAALQPLLSRVDALGAQASLPRANLQQQVISGGGDQPEIVVGAWRRLGELSSPQWPATAAELESERRAQENLGRVIARVSSPGRREALQRELDGQRLPRWLSAAKQAATAADLDVILSEQSRQAFGVAAEEITDDRVRVNILLRDLRAGVVENLPDDRTREIAETFLARVPGDAAPRVVQSVRALLEGDESAAPAIDPATLGPATAGWTGTNGAGGVVTFSRSVGGEQVSIDFIPIVPEGGETVFIARTELSIRQLAAILDSAQATSAAREGGALKAFDWSNDSTLSGPHPWQWGAGAAAVAPAPSWVPPGPWQNYQNPFYSSSLAGSSGASSINAQQGEPTPDSPANWVSPKGALYISKVFGCRAPTIAEWTAAYQRFAADDPQSTFNLRDQTWLSQKEHIRQVRAPLANQGAAASYFWWPDDSVFVPRERPPGADVATAHQHTDGRLWFAPVGEATDPRAGPSAWPAAEPAHLVGNVAEYVLEDSAAASDIDAAEIGTPDGWFAYLNGHRTALAVIGGSALSAPEVSVTASQPVPPIQLRSASGFADVGLRPAFSASGAAAPPQPLWARVQKLLEADPYVLPGG